MRAAALAIILAIGCDPITGTYTCSNSAECVNDNKQGYCEATQYCSFDDTSCPTGRRYDPSAGSDASACVTGIVTGSLVERYAINDATFAPSLVESPIAAPALSVVLDDGTSPAIAYTAGNFVFQLAHASQSYTLTIDGQQLQLAAPHVTYVERSIGRPDRVPVTMPTQIRFDYNFEPGPGNDMIASTGLWTQTLLPDGPDQFPWNYAMASSISGPLGLLDATKNDRLYFTKFGLTSPGVQTIIDVAPESVTLADGMTTNLPLEMLQPSPADQCGRIVSAIPTELARLMTASPESTMTSVNWLIATLPAKDKLSTEGELFVVAANNIATTSSIDIPQDFANPFVGSEPVGKLQVFAGRSFSMMGIGGPNLVDSVQLWVPFPSTAVATCLSNIANLASTVALVGTTTVAGVDLTSDDQVAAVDPTHTLQVTLSLGSPGDASVYVVTLYQVTNDGSTTSLTELRSYETVQPMLSLAPGVLASGNTYVFQIQVSTAFPNAAAGDFDTVQEPQQLSTRWSHSFVVQ